MIITPFLVFYMLLVFVLLFLFLNTVDKRKWLTGLLSFVLAPIVYFYLFYPFINIISSYHHQKYFDSDDWHSKPSLRYEMIDHTMTSDTLVGLQKNNVRALLGKEEWLSWNDAKNAHDTDKWNYGLGIKPGAFNDKRQCVEIIFKKDKVDSLRPFTEDITFDEKK